MQAPGETGLTVVFVDSGHPLDPAAWKLFEGGVDHGGDGGRARRLGDAVAVVPVGRDRRLELRDALIRGKVPRRDVRVHRRRRVNDR